MRAPAAADLLLYAVCAGGILWVGLRGEGASESASPRPAAAGRAAPPAGVRVVRARPAVTVHVVGAVARPGVYRLADGRRVRDAVARAGGASSRADLAAINLAARIADGQQIAVPVRQAAAVPGTAPGAASGDGPVHLSTATAEQLDTLDGIGPALARKILDYRTEHGAITSLDQLGEVPGIGPKTIAALDGRLQP